MLHDTSKKDLIDLVSNDVINKVLDCSLEVRAFEVQSRYYIHFRTDTAVNDKKN